jgi:hypothetical protein
MEGNKEERPSPFVFARCSVASQGFEKERFGEKTKTQKLVN